VGRFDGDTANGGAVVNAEDIKKGDELIAEDSGRVLWTALSDAGKPVGDSVFVNVRAPNGVAGVRWLTVGRNLPIRRKGES
jgi:hypothetical protein